MVDFTQKTDAEILAYLTQTSSQACGRFRAGQLGQPLQLPETTPSWRGWLGALLAASGLLSGSAFRAAAQTPATQQPVAADTATNEPAYSLPRAELGAQPADTLVELRGIVLDAERCEPLPGVTIVLKNTSRGTTTNAEGEFVLQLEPTKQPAQLLFSFVGFISQEHTATFQDTAPRRIQVALDTQVVGELLVSYSPPWPWRPRALYQWGKFWLTRPFRN